VRKEAAEAAKGRLLSALQRLSSAIDGKAEYTMYQPTEEEFTCSLSLTETMWH
jgi:hypothetical protein